VAFSSRKLEILYREAQRQRASKFSLLGQIINMPNMKEGDQKDFRKSLDKVLNPYFVVKQIKQEEVAESWASLRKRGR
jgi:hypothetical protein